jgi:hypothetical protein
MATITRTQSFFVNLALFFMPAVSIAGVAMVSIIPHIGSSTTVPENSAVTIEYVVTNHSYKNNPKTLIMTPVAGIQQVGGAGTCASPSFSLGKNESCILSLQVVGSSLASNGHRSCDPKNKKNTCFPEICTNENDSQCYNPSQNNTIKVISQQYAYLPGSLDGNIYQCTFDSTTGLFSSCPITYSNQDFNGAATITFATIGETRYAYLAVRPSYIYQCTLNPDGSFKVCISLTLPDDFVNLNSITFATVAGTQYAYISQMGASPGPSPMVHRCSLNLDGSLNVCMPTNSMPFGSNPNGVAFATVNQTQYAYVSDNGLGVVNQCTLNPIGAFNTCTSTPMNNSPFNTPENVAFATVEGTQYAYVADDSNNAIYQCTLNNNGSFNICTPTPTPASWVPFDIAFATAGSTQYAYVVSNNESTIVYRCTLFSGGLFDECTPTPTPPLTWSPFSIALNAIA